MEYIFGYLVRFPDSFYAFSGAVGVVGVVGVGLAVVVAAAVVAVVFFPFAFPLVQPGRRGERERDIYIYVCIFIYIYIILSHYNHHNHHHNHYQLGCVRKHCFPWYSGRPGPEGRVFTQCVDGR